MHFELLKTEKGFLQPLGDPKGDKVKVDKWMFDHWLDCRNYELNLNRTITIMTKEDFALLVKAPMNVLPSGSTVLDRNKDFTAAIETLLGIAEANNDCTHVIVTKRN